MNALTLKFDLCSNVLILKFDGLLEPFLTTYGKRQKEWALNTALVLHTSRSASDDEKRLIQCFKDKIVSGQFSRHDISLLAATCPGGAVYENTLAMGIIEAAMLTASQPQPTLENGAIPY